MRHLDVSPGLLNSERMWIQHLGIYIFNTIANLWYFFVLTVDNAYITQSRFILLDSMLIFFMTAAVYSYVKFSKCRNHPYSWQWWVWLHSTGIFIALTTSVKYVGLFTVALVGVATIQRLYTLLNIKIYQLTVRQWYRRFKSRAWGLIVIPVVVYLLGFAIHFYLLNHSGPGDTFMSHKFQTSLIGNKVSFKTGNVYYGDIVRIYHGHVSAYLHSHQSKYPLTYSDGRVSSQGMILA